MDLKETVTGLLPERFRESLKLFSRQKDWMELRMRTGAILAASAFDGNFLLGARGIRRPGEKCVPCDARELAQTVSALCGGSGYRYFDTLSGGFLTLDNGIRLGIAGDRKGVGARVPELLTGLNIRLPALAEEAADAYLQEIREEPLISTLVISPPGGGKTTFLRALAKKLSLGAFGRPGLRVTVVDDRRELFPAILFRGNCDVLTGLSKAEGISRGIRLFSPQVLIFDEFGGEAEIAAAKEAGRSGVVLFTSCHGSDVSEVLARPGIAALKESGVFTRFLIITPLPGPHFSAVYQRETIL